MGASSGGEAGRHYRVAWHDGLCLGPLDAYCALEAGTKMVWEGRVTASSAWQIEQPQLWGGEKDQGGVQGRIRVMFGEADQQPNAYLTGIFGDQTVAWRGIATVAWEGGRWGANNPNPQPWSHLVERIKQGWDNDECWYPETAAIPLVDAGATGGGMGVPAEFGYNLGQRALVTSPPLGPSSTFTVEIAEAYGWSYTALDEAFWFWRPNESGLFYVKLYGASDETAVLALVDDGWQLGETALIRFNSGDLYVVLLTLDETEPYAPDGYGWILSPAPISTSLGTVRLWQAPMDVVGDNNPSVGSDTGGRYLKNPAHIILEAHTASYHAGHPIETVNLDSLTAAADWFYANDFGLGTARHPDKESPEEYIARIERVAGCSFSQSNEDGLWYLDIANGEYDLETLPVLTDNDVLEFEEIATVLDDAVNSVSVKYFDPLRKEAITTRPLQAIALIAEFGENHQTYEFPEIANEAVAARVRQREGLATTTPTRAFNLVTTPKTRSWRKSTYFRLQLPKRGIADMVCIVAEGDEGKLASGACQFKATQDIYSLPSTVYDSTEPGVDTRPPQTPVPVEAQRLIEAPYIDAVAQFTPAEFAALAPDVGFAVGIAANPGGMLDFTLAVDAGAGYQTKADGDYCPSCTVPGEVSPGQITGIAIADGDLMATVEPGVLCLWDDELCRVDAIDLDAGTIDLGRGCGHTIPAFHPAGSRMFFYQSAAAADSTEYTDGETIDGKLLSNTGGKRLALADADALSLTFNRRLARPYPPANVTINGQPVFEVGGGGGGGGGGSAPSTPPPLTPDGTPADTTTGPNGGYADDAPYPIPPPTTLGTDVLPGGDFGDPADLGQWRNRDGSALGAGWSLVDGKLTHIGGGVAAAYCYGARLSLPISPIPRYTVSVEMDVQCDPSVVTRVGIAWGVSTNGGTPNYVEASEAATYPAEVTVSHEWTRVVERASMLGAGTIPVVTFMPYVEHTGALGGSLATVDNAHLVITEVPTPSTPETPDHIDFDAGLTGWTLWPDPTSANPYAPTMAVSGGELSMTVTSEYFTYRWVICDDPLVGADAIGKYIGGPLEVWCNDDGTITDATGTYTFGGAALAVATKLPGQDYIPFTAALPQRGDWTERESWVRQIQDETNAPGVTHHIAVLMRCSPGKTVKVRNIQPRVTDEVID